MTTFADPITVPHMHVHRGGQGSLSCAVGDAVAGIQECDECALEFEHVAGRVFVDDIELSRRHCGTYHWRPDFLAGRVEITVIDSVGIASYFHVDVQPANAKIDVPRYEHMIAEIKQYRAALLLGDSGARKGFGHSQSHGFDDMVRLARLLKHGPAFVAALRGLERTARPTIRPHLARVSLSRAKRLSASALREPRIAAFATGHLAPERALALSVPAYVAEPTLDTAPHRALKLLAMRVEAALLDLLGRICDNKLKGHLEEHMLRRERRETALRQLQASLQSVSCAEPLRSVTRPELTAAALTQLAASPLYAAAYRHGTRALNLGVSGASETDQLSVRATWGIYEAWCYIAILKELAKAFGSSWKACRGTCPADESWRLQLSENFTLDLHFQAVFPAGSRAEPARMWSVSRQRIPDIVLVLRGRGQIRFGVLDAKYRRHRHNVLEAMESAHLYRDSLRLSNERADFCFLLLPAETDVAHLDTDDCHSEHCVGTICDFAPNRKGLQRGIHTIRRWINLHTGETNYDA